MSILSETDQQRLVKIYELADKTSAGDWKVIPKYCAHEICDARGLLIATVRNEHDCGFIVQAKKDLQWLAMMIMDLDRESTRVPE